jgi:hypothetical protein
VLGPKDPEGRTAWDYAAGIWGELYRLRELQQDHGDKSQIRWLSAVGDNYTSLGASEARIRVPAGCRWTALAVSAWGGDDTASQAYCHLYRNVVQPTGFITKLESGGSDPAMSMVNLPDNLVLEENTILIASFTLVGGAPLTHYPTLNVATREVVFGPGPERTEEGGEDLIGYNVAAIDPDLEREDEVEYQEATR